MVRLCSLAITALFCLAGPGSAQSSGLEKLREQLPKLQKDLEGMRGQSFPRAVKSVERTDAELLAHRQQELDRVFPKARTLKLGKLLRAIGVLPKGASIRDAYATEFATYVTGAYDARRNTLYLVRPRATPEHVHSGVIHELTHALQDQRFGLDSVQEKVQAGGGNVDRELAFNLFFEGEACYFEYRWRLEKRGRGAELAAHLEGRAQASRLSMEALHRQQATELGLPKDAFQVIRLREELSNFVYCHLIEPGYKGAHFAARVVSNRGVEGLDALFERPPTSTEQILHPKKALGPGRDDPVALTLPDVAKTIGSGAKLVTQNVIGELTLRTLFLELRAGAQPEACSGWDGDRVQLYSLAGGKKQAIVWLLTWDTPEDAASFAHTLNRFRVKGPPALANADLTYKGRDVLLVGGVPAEAVAEVKRVVRAGVKRK